MPSESETQGRRILMLLHASWPEWTPAPQLAKISLQCASRIHELRKAGWTISNRIQHRGRSKHGFYRLGEQPVPPGKEVRAARAAAPEPAPAPASLFGDISIVRERSYLE